MTGGLPPTSIYLLPKTKAKLLKAAKADRRSLSALISIIAEDWLEAQKLSRRHNSRA